MARTPRPTGRAQPPAAPSPLNLKAWRLHAGLTQAELAKRVHVAVTTVYRWEAGDRAPSLAMVSRIAKVYDVPEFRLHGYPDRPSIDALIVDAPDSVRDAVTAAAMDAYRKAAKAH